MRVLLPFLIAICLKGHSQQAEPILFQEKAYDFGEITEEGGNAVHDFVFVNNTGRVVRIVSVKASCGCTTPDWSRDAVPPGKSGFVKASYDPKGRPGYFSKSLTVTTDFDSNPIALQIRGQVAGKSQQIDLGDFPTQYGTLRSKSSSFNLGKIFINQPPSPKEFTLYNGGDKAIGFTGKNEGPAYISIETPKTLAPGEKGTIRLSYDARVKNQYGFVMDNVIINTDDQAQLSKSFSVYATIEEFFPVLSPEEAVSAPVLRIENPVLDLGRITQGHQVDRSISVRNPGKKELEIRSVQANCSCVIAIMEPVRIKAGGEGKLNISFVSQGRSGLQQKAVTLYSNDPRNPVQRVTLTGIVNDK
jgi:hypothetical protein